MHGQKGVHPGKGKRACPGAQTHAPISHVHVPHSALTCPYPLAPVTYLTAQGRPNYVLETWLLHWPAPPEQPLGRRRAWRPPTGSAWRWAPAPQPPRPGERGQRAQQAPEGKRKAPAGRGCQRLVPPSCGWGTTTNGKQAGPPLSTGLAPAARGQGWSGGNPAWVRAVAATPGGGGSGRAWWRRPGVMGVARKCGHGDLRTGWPRASSSGSAGQVRARVATLMANWGCSSAIAWPQFDRP